MLKPFNDFVFSKKVGSTGIVETDYGFHVIKVVAKDDVVLLASIAEKNVPSDETSDKVFNLATKFEMSLSKDLDFSTLANESDYDIKVVNGVKILDNDFPGLQDQRRVVQWLFSDETKLLDFKRFDVSKGGYLIAQVTKITDEGISSPDDVSFRVLPEVIKSKKADYIIGNNNFSNSIEQLANQNNTVVKKALALNQKNATVSDAGFEPLIIGTSFSINENNSSDYIIGDNGVYKLRVTKKYLTEFNDESFNFVNSFRNQLQLSNRANISFKIFESLKETAEIEDNRSTYY